MMLRVLVVGEKPSVSRSIAAVLGATEKRNGYYEGNGYLVSWCIGHLVELAPPSAYDDKYGKWRREDLPILPEHWQHSVQEGTKAQFTILRRLMNDPHVDSLICATDAGREGELIFRLVYEQCGCRKPFARLWISSMEEAAIREGFQNLKPSSIYDALYQAALCRAQADWLVGINATRLFSTMYGHTLNIGRVMSPTLAMVVGREAQIGAFQPTLFYHVQLDCGEFTAQSERLHDKTEAEHIVSLCHGKEATIVSLNSTEKAENPPKLYDLTSLQREANRRFGYTAQQTLDYTQTLYEKKLCTYPRTDSRYLTQHMEHSTRTLVDGIAEAMPFPVSRFIACNPTRVIDDTKVSDHHAILPTGSAAGTDMKVLPAGERSILTLLMARLLCAVGEPCRKLETTVTFDCEGITFTTKGSSMVSDGWKAIEAAVSSGTPVNEESGSATNDSLPKLQEGMDFPSVAASIREGQTSPPKHFTEDTLLSAMEKLALRDAAGVEDERPDVPAKGLGTPATRAGILEKLASTGLMQRKNTGKQAILLPSAKGIALITVLPEELQSPELTAEWEHRLRQIEQGELDPQAFMEDIESMVESLVHSSQPIKDAHILFPDDRKPIGTCPRCGSKVVESPRSFSCTNPGCRFVLWKNNRFFTSKRKELTASVAMALLADGKAPLKGLYSEKTGKTYDATVLLDDTSGEYVNFKLHF